MMFCWEKWKGSARLSIKYHKIYTFTMCPSSISVSLSLCYSIVPLSLFTQWEQDISLAPSSAISAQATPWLQPDKAVPSAATSPNSPRPDASEISAGPPKQPAAPRELQQGPGFAVRDARGHHRGPQWMIKCGR